MIVFPINVTKNVTDWWLEQQSITSFYTWKENEVDIVLRNFWEMVLRNFWEMALRIINDQVNKKKHLVMREREIMLWFYFPVFIYIWIYVQIYGNSPSSSKNLGASILQLKLQTIQTAGWGKRNYILSQRSLRRKRQ